MVGSETRYQAFLKALGKDQLRRELTPVDPSGARSLQVGGKAYVNLASNDYLALRFHEALIARSAWDGSHDGRSRAASLVSFAACDPPVVSCGTGRRLLFKYSGAALSTSVAPR